MSLPISNSLHNTLIETSPPSVAIQHGLTTQHNWELPLAKAQVTFIYHDCQMDREGYTLYPNENTTFVLQPGAQITNFGNVGYSQRLPAMRKVRTTDGKPSEFAAWVSCSAILENVTMPGLHQLDKGR
ncbi:hypothetical protein PGT21_012595 [Puccinia graminis f. sp. tritici]|uniref:Uncharacterized protein n=1 Tax=Puccinia graminis f. sp. tritici TaxID=56615 RepID=A0A5B0Q2A6_PUCGR|nr:hypothetical protein PGT21_012595 [Puccinia graminis f. sp. tritici]KAA1124792.1 hypothetical protein PGTUg99_034912 [Puccinia graminis f. sp. tritici]